MTHVYSQYEALISTIRGGRGGKEEIVLKRLKQAAVALRRFFGGGEERIVSQADAGAAQLKASFIFVCDYESTPA